MGECGGDSMAAAPSLRNRQKSFLALVCVVGFVLLCSTFGLNWLGRLEALRTRVELTCTALAEPFDQCSAF